MDDIIFGSTKRSWCDEFEALMKSRFQMSSMGELTFFLRLQVKQKEDGIFISQDKYVAEILKKFDFASVKTASTPIETQKPLVKDEEDADVDVTLKTSHLNVVKRIFRYLKGKLKLGLWYPKVSSFDLDAYSDSDYVGANCDRMNLTYRGCQFLNRRLISWQCKKQTIMATSTTEAEYVAAVNCCGQVLWIQNQMHHFIRDAYEKKLIQVLNIHTDDNVDDLLTKAFDSYLGSRVQLKRAIDGTKELLLPNFFNFWLTKVSTDRLIVSTDRQSLYRYKAVGENTAKGLNCWNSASSDRSLSGNEDGLTLQSVYDLCVSLCKQVTIQAKQIKDLKARIKKLKKKARPMITHHKAWMKSVSMKTRLSGKKSMQKKWMQKESVSKQGRKTAKSKPTTHKDQAFDDLDDFDAMDYMETEDAHKENGVSTEDQVSIVKPDEGTDKLKVSTDKIDEGIAELKNGNSDENATPTATPTIFGDDETIAEFLVSMSQNKAKQKGVEIKDAKDSDRQDNIEEKKSWAGIARGATKAALIRDYDDILLRIKVDNSALDCARIQRKKERKKFTIEERAKLLHDTIAAQRKFLAQQREAEIRSIPPTRTQLRNQMMTYLKHVGGKKHSDLKTKNFKEIQVLYEKIKRFDENFIAIGSAEDERLIKDVNKKATGKKKDDSIKKESKEKESTRKRKLGTRKKMKSRKRRFRQDTSQDDQTDSEKENDELRLCLTIALDEDKEVDYEILNKKYPIIEWKSDNRQKRYFSTLMRVLSIFDRDDLNVVYQLVMDRYQDEIPEGFDRVLWGDLMIMFNPDNEDEFWNSQQDWNVVSWKLHGSSGVHTLMTEAGLVIYMLVEKKYPLRKKVLLQMLELKLESEEDSTMALELIRFVKKIVAELEPEDSDGDEEDL
ncbi:putative ribonuclease H-like domain-containing protein [Tanacetum coccineum]|uniref:Ribonuclease H-like domain-containing protein n=1 Tax=Tanacetum coccineum TaxID=301880 RepID=A0ABQ5FKB7_9ASTR